MYCIKMALPGSEKHIGACGPLVGTGLLKQEECLEGCGSRPLLLVLNRVSGPRGHTVFLFFFNWRCSCSRWNWILSRQETYLCVQSKEQHSNSQWKTEQTPSNLGKSINNSQSWKVSWLMPNSKGIFLLRPLDTESLCYCTSQRLKLTEK